MTGVQTCALPIYDEAFLTNGDLRLATIPGFAVTVAHLFDDDKPNPYEVTQALIATRTID